MKFIVKHRIDSGLIISNDNQIEIDGFTLLLDPNGNNTAKYIHAEVEAHTQEEAKRKARKLFTQFLAKLTLLDNSKYVLLEHVSVSDGNTTMGSISISTRVSLGISGDEVKAGYLNRMKNKRLRVRPLQHYADGINDTDPFEQYRNFYRVLENYLKSTKGVTTWVQKQMPTIEMKTGKNKQTLTIISWIRHKLSHAKARKEESIPLSISNPQDVFLVQKYVPIVRDLAREIIREYEKI